MAKPFPKITTPWRPRRQDWNGELIENGAFYVFKTSVAGNRVSFIGQDRGLRDERGHVGRDRHADGLGHHRRSGCREVRERAADGGLLMCWAIIFRAVAGSRSYGVSLVAGFVVTRPYSWRGDTARRRFIGG